MQADPEAVNVGEGQAQDQGVLAGPSPGQPDRLRPRPASWRGRARRLWGIRWCPRCTSACRCRPGGPCRVPGSGRPRDRRRGRSRRHRGRSRGSRPRSSGGPSTARPGRAAASTASSSRRAAAGLTGTTTKPARRAPRCATTRSPDACPAKSTRSPGRTPLEAIRPATALVRSRSSAARSHLPSGPRSTGAEGSARQRADHAAGKLTPAVRSRPVASTPSGR